MVFVDITYNRDSKINPSKQQDRIGKNLNYINKRPKKYNYLFSFKRKLSIAPWDELLVG
jgi:hypothetical protein